MTSAADPPDPPSASKPDERDPEERDPGLARERTSLAWTRTAIAFAACGGTVLKENVVTGLIILAMAPLIWQLGRVTRSDQSPTALPAMGATRIRLITISIVGVSLLSLVVALFGHSVPGALRLIARHAPTAVRRPSSTRTLPPRRDDIIAHNSPLAFTLHRKWPFRRPLCPEYPFIFYAQWAGDPGVTSRQAQSAIARRPWAAIVVS